MTEMVGGGAAAAERSMESGIPYKEDPSKALFREYFMRGGCLGMEEEYRNFHEDPKARRVCYRGGPTLPHAHHMVPQSPPTANPRRRVRKGKEVIRGGLHL